MRIGLIADTHIPEAGPDVWESAYAAFAGCDCILHAGDVYDIHVVDRLSAIATTYVARGNGDDGSGGRPIQPDDDRMRTAWLLELGGLGVGLVHDMPIPVYGSYTVERALTRHFGRTDLDVVVYGDSHVEAIDTVDGVYCVNPGSPTLPHGLSTQHGTIGFLEIAAGTATATIRQLTEDGHEPFDWSRWRRQ